ncbi:Small G protein signaling modulator 3 [Hypsibius exemplaris]|uniref:RUN and TBC1 domain-containing protein 3 n=1 Tax=Hypsibius exemplaris TaxID=2072580 RepID=A0A9X6NGZ2_HYPEX|nr:Small G protein signaling modulator 3 [Hypsibius exemplaris]
MAALRGLCGSRGDRDYFGKEDTVKIEKAFDADDLVEKNETDGGFTPVAGGPFSALIPSLWPQKILRSLSEGSVDGISYNQFGFVVKEGDDVPTIPEDNSPQKLQWLAHLEFSANDKNHQDLTWDKLQYKIARTEKLRGMILDGIPHSLRGQMWMRLSGAVEKKYGSEIAYGDIVRNTCKIHKADDRLIDKDLLRIFPTHPCFLTKTSVGVKRLRRVLQSLVWMYPNIGYCPGYGSIVAPLLLFVEENDAFWLMSVIVELLLPPSYFAHGMLGAQADQKVLLELIGEYLPELQEKLKREEIDLTLITISWFMSLFSNVLTIQDLLPLWDWFFYDGSIVLFQTTIGMLKLKLDHILDLDSALLFNYLSNLPNECSSLRDVMKLGIAATPGLTPETIHQKRQTHLASMMAATGSLFAPNFPFNMPNQEVSQGSHSGIFRNFMADSSASSKQKNIRLTELLVTLREVILRICRHFETHDPALDHVNTVADYSIESHLRDREVFGTASRSHCRRAKAVMDFERTADDELGFRKNDVIMIISQADEHCWTGELNGLRGWFPARFAELLDERGKEYSPAGDDTVSETIGDLVREGLCHALLAVFEHGIQQSVLLGTQMHPWAFIEEVADKEMNNHYQSVYARLNLCKAYKLDEDARLLTAEELLYKAVTNINISHNRLLASSDCKFRSFICSGLNDQVLHLWLNLLCSCPAILEKWYHPWSLLRSPAWMQIKCELRILSQLCFTLAVDADPTFKKSRNYPLQGSVRELLVKHWLFSWELQ